MGLSDETTADIGGLFDYYKAMGESGKDIGKVWMPSFNLAASALVGSSGVTEALQFQQKLAGVVEAFSKFMSDSGNGVRYLADGALSIADNYATADMDMAAEMTSVADAFTPTPDRSDVADANSAQFASQREAYFHPTYEKDKLPPPVQSDTVGKCYDVPPTADEEASWHTRKFKGLETWTPDQTNGLYGPDADSDEEIDKHVSVF